MTGLFCQTLEGTTATWNPPPSHRPRLLADGHIGLETRASCEMHAGMSDSHDTRTRGWGVENPQSARNRLATMSATVRSATSLEAEFV